MRRITKIALQNFKRFKSFEVEFDPEINLLVGDNESGKSTILTAIDLVLSGSRSKVETFGLDTLFNTDVITDFLASDREPVDLPIMCIDVFFNDFESEEMNGKVNCDDRECNGLRLRCFPNDELSHYIKEILKDENAPFPFEFYSIAFKTFSGEAFSGYKRFLRHLMIDNSLIGSEYATRSYVRSMYSSYASETEKSIYANEYRKHKDNFKETVFADLNAGISNYAFAVKSSSKTNLETDLTIVEDDIGIDNKGRGRQCFIKTEFALQKGEADLDLVLLEEPENHLSHANLNKLLAKINSSEKKQLFIATHSNLLSARLDLRKSILLNSASTTPALLKNLDEDTANYFIKAPDNNILQMILSKKVILVEGDAEYLLMDAFFENVTSGKLINSDVHVISVGGIRFPRYLQVAKLLKIRTAVITDNDHDIEKNVTNKYEDYKDVDHIEIYCDPDEKIHTFEVALYQENSKTCDALFGKRLKSNSVPEYMQEHKTDVALRLLKSQGSSLAPPQYITNAIRWINE